MATQTKVSYDPNASYEVKVFDVVYRKDEQGNDWELRIYQPQGPGPFPALIDVHGGQWRYANRMQNTLIDTLAETGLVVASPEFRRSDTTPYPAQVQDVNWRRAGSKPTRQS